MKSVDRIKNAKLKHAFKILELNAEGNCEETVDLKMGILNNYEQFFKTGLIKCGNSDSFVKYKKHLEIDKKLGLKSYQFHCSTIKGFYKMVIEIPGYKRKIKRNDLAYLNIKNSERNSLNTTKYLKEIPTIDEWKRLIDSIKVRNAVDMRDKALIVLLLLAPTRVATITSLKLIHFKVDDLIIVIDPTKGVSSKKGYGNWGIFLIFEPDYLKYFNEYFDYLIQNNFTNRDPLFPRSTPYRVDRDGTSTFDRLSYNQLKSTISINNMLRDRSEKCCIKYYSPHRYRDLHFYLARKCCINEEQRLAVENNFGHKGDTTAQKYYGNITKFERFDILDQIDFSRHNQKPSSLQDINKLEKKIDKISEDNREIKEMLMRFLKSNTINVNSHRTETKRSIK